MGKGTSNMFKLLQDNPASKDRLGFGPALGDVPVDVEKLR